jgi:hypothetical protein
VANVRQDLETKGWAVLSRGPSLDPAADPWGYAEALFGERPLLLERQPIRPVAGGRSFASRTGGAPLHTDSQALLGVPSHVQVLVCARAAESGGETTLVDAWRLVTRIEREDPELYPRLFQAPRALRFYFGTFTGPTVSRRRGHVFFSHPPAPDPEDALGARLQEQVAREPREVLRLETSEVLLVNNHRMLHGRLPFSDSRRELVRLLVWLREPFRAPAAIASRALEASPLAALEPLDARRVALVRELLAGTPPGVIERRERIREEELYRWRDALFASELR